jgi:probable rRNA maturation factor
MFSYQILNHPESFQLDEECILSIFESVSDCVDISQKGILNIAFLSDDEIQVYNREYRWIDSTTDVLSFHYFEDFSDIAESDIAGEIILSESRILTQSSDHQHTPHMETEILILHGILHILWFDHETDEDYASMWKYECTIRDKLKLTI